MPDNRHGDAAKGEEMGDAKSNPYIVKQIKFYEDQKAMNRRWYAAVTIAKLALAAALPVIALVKNPPFEATLVAGIIGAIIVFLEGLNQFGQFRQNWLRYGMTVEAIKAEVALRDHSGEPYRTQVNGNGDALLIERVVALVQAETQSWRALGENVPKEATK